MNTPTRHFDPEPFLRMVDHDYATFAELAQTFLDLAKPQVKEIGAASDSRDSRLLKERAHAFRGSLAVFRAAPALVIVEDIEKLARDHPGEGVGTLVDELDAEIQLLCAEMEAYVRAADVLASAAAAAEMKPGD